MLINKYFFLFKGGGGGKGIVFLKLDLADLFIPGLKCKKNDKVKHWIEKKNRRKSINGKWREIGDYVF